MLGLAKALKDLLVLVDLLVELNLEFLLRHANEEVANEFGNRLTDRADSDLEDGVDSGSDLLHKDVLAPGLWLLIHVWLILGHWVAGGVVLRRHLVLLGHDRSAVLLVIGIVHEDVVLL